MVVDNNIPTDFLERYVKCLYNTQKYKVALDICRNIRGENFFIQVLLQIEFLINFNIKRDMKEANNIAKMYLEKYPNELFMKIHYADTLLYLERTNELKEFLENEIVINYDLFRLDVYFINRLIVLLEIVSLNDKLLAFLYEYVRFKPNDYNSLSQYNIKFLFMGDELIGNNAPKCIESDTAFAYKQNEKKIWYVLDNRPFEDLKENEINNQHPLYSKFISKVLNQEVILSENDFGDKDIVKIVDIKSKYLYMYDKVRDRYFTLFPNSPALWKINVKHNEPEDIINRISSIIKPKNEINDINKILEYYKQGVLPLSVLAKLFQKDLYDIAYAIIYDKEIDFNAFIFLNHLESEQIKDKIKFFTKATKFIIDFTTIIILFELRIENIISKHFSIGIAQSVIDNINELIFKTDKLKDKGYSNFFIDNGQPGLFKITPDALKFKLEKLKKIKSWCDENCEILPCSKRLEIDNDKLQKLENVFEYYDVDTVLLALEEGHVLFSDDIGLRNLSKSFNVKSVWTQFVLLSLKNLSKIDYPKYIDVLIKMKELSYRSIIIDASVLFNSINFEEKFSNKKFIKLLKLMKLQNKSLVESIGSFLQELLNNRIPSYIRYTFLKKMVRILFKYELLNNKAGFVRNMNEILKRTHNQDIVRELQILFLFLK